MNRDSDKGKILILRSLFLGGIQLFLLFMIIFRLYYLQVYQADKYRTLADENRISTRLLVPPRGIIYDRHMTMLAGNRQNFQALMVAEQTTDIDETLNAFKKIMPLSGDEEKRIRKDLRRNRSFVPVKIKDNLDWEQVTQILLNAPDLPGVIIDEGLSRFYPYGNIFAHVIGYVASVGENDIKDDPLLEVPGFKIGKSGIERLFEKDLRGKSGNLKVEVNAVGRVMKEIERVDGVVGNKIDLSLDLRLQQKAYELLRDESGAIVMMKVDTGEVLAFASAPAFDPNMFARGLSSEEWKELNSNEKKPLLNKAVAGLYSPGSTFKMVVGLAALESGMANKKTRSFCAGKMMLENHAFHCWKDIGHGYIDMVQALQHSCDIFFYEIAQKIGIEKIAAMARRFGLGKKTNVGIENEKSGLIPDIEWKRKRFGEPWRQGESIISGIGQGYILTTPIQLATMVSRIANGGYEIEPTFKKVDKNSKIEPKKMDLSSQHLEIVKKGMYEVVNVPGGTAFSSRFDFEGKKMAGKTGTTQVRRISMKERQSGVLKQEDLPWKYRNHALFVGYAPHDNPKYGIAVLVEHGGSGSAVAAPMAGKMLLEALKLDSTNKPVE
ncbi:MAG: penicillin-binding protein 2 [Alphaproteobacteria bacterium]|nr:penicillin-binding protein 2 [Alphaproteobacteria bacterium]